MANRTDDFDDSVECTDETDFAGLIEDAGYEASGEQFNSNDIAGLLALE